MKTVIFDMDGVLVNTERTHYQALCRTLARVAGRTMDWDYYAQFVGTTLTHMWSVIERDYDLPGQTAALDRAFEADKAYYREKNGHVPVPGAPELVRSLKAAGCTLAVASSSPQREIDAAMAALGLTDCFTVLISGETIARPKPAPDIFLKAAELLGADPSACAVVEDSANGVGAAKAAGMFCVGFVNPDSGDQDLTPADRLVTTMAAAGDALRAGPQPVLRTDRLILRPLTIADAAAMYPLCADPEIGGNAGWKPHESEAETAQILRSFFLGQDIWAATRALDGALMGTVGVISDPKRENADARMLGYWLGKPYWGLGYMTEAVRAVLAHVFDTMGAPLVSAYCYPDNARSKRVLEKAGFRYEGLMRQCERRFDGALLDNVCLSITADEFAHDCAARAQEEDADAFDA